MATPQEVREVTFERVRRGYRCEDVDDYLQQIANDLEALFGQVSQMAAAKEDAEQKVYILAQKVEEYRREEDTLKTALLNAQRMGENIIREARQKAEGILREASIKAEDITRGSKEQVEEQTLELQRLQSEVAHFKASVLSLYKQHIESLSTLPEQETRETPEPAQPEEAEEPETPPTGTGPAALPQAQPAPVPAQSIPEPEAPGETPEAPNTPDTPEAPETPDIWSMDFQPDLKPPAEEIPAQTVVFTPAKDEAPAEEEDNQLPSIFKGFQGIRFSD